MDFINVQVGKMPGILTGAVVEAGSTVAHILEVAGITMEQGYEVRVDNEVATSDTIVDRNGAIIVLTKMVKGN